MRRMSVGSIFWPRSSVKYLVLDEVSIKGGVMKLGTGIRTSAFAILVLAVVSMSWLHAQQRPAARVAIDAEYIGGVVTTTKGHEAEARVMEVARVRSPKVC